jgi:hypothetical protein
MIGHRYHGINHNHITHSHEIHNHTDEDLPQDGSYLDLVFTVAVLGMVVFNCGIRLYKGFCERINSRPMNEPILTREVYVEEANDLEKSGFCPICLEHLKECDIEDSPDMGAVIKIKCGHVFHSGCVREWFEKKRSCPVCRTGV